MQTDNSLLKYLLEIITIENVIIFFLLYLFIIWFFIIVWVIKDISNRTNNIFLQFISILIVIIFPLFWIILYLIVRPKKTLFDKYSEEIEENLNCLNLEIKEKIWKKNFELINCPKCNKKIEKEFKFCPYCKIELKKECLKCHKLLEIDWNKCPYCWEQKNNKKNSNSKKVESWNKNSKKKKNKKNT